MLSPKLFPLLRRQACRDLQTGGVFPGDGAQDQTYHNRGGEEQSSWRLAHRDIAESQRMG